MTQQDKVIDFMKEHGTITSLEMFEKFCICCPHSVIRDVRKNHNVTDEWQKASREEIVSGKSKIVITRYKKWIYEGEKPQHEAA